MVFKISNDVGQLWENFIFIERLKKCSYTGFYGNRYFWRTYQGQEVDFLEEIENTFTFYEAKWSTKREVKPPPLLAKHFPASTFNVITPQNYLQFIT